MDLLDKIKNLSKKQKAYFGAFMAIVALLAWAFISAGVITHNFNNCYSFHLISIFSRAF